MVQISAREVGRNLELRLGEAPAEGDDDDRPRIVVPPVNAAVGSLLFARYNTILFARAPADPQKIAEEATKIALGAWIDPEQELDEAEVERRKARWQAVEDLRWAEGELVCQAALYWNIQGGGLDVVDVLLSKERDALGEPLGGAQKAQEMLLRRANLWTAYSRLMTLLSSGEEPATPEPDGSSDTSTPSGTSESASAPESAA